LRFPIGNHYSSPFDLRTTEGILRFLNPLISFVESVTDNGHNVLIHCLAGAHRAGTSGIVWLMYVHQLKAAEAIKLA